MAHKITRRDFIKAGALSTGAAILTGCKFPPRWEYLVPYVRPPEQQIPGVATWFASGCSQCPAGCGIIVRIMNGRAKKIDGNPQHPLNQGKLCAKGHSGLQLLYHPDRLTGPIQQQNKGSQDYQAVSWADGVKILADKLKAAGKGVAIWTGSSVSGHVYYLYSTLAKATGGPAPIVYDLQSIMNGYSAQANSNQKYTGMAGVPLHDISQADVVFSFGGDFLTTGTSPVSYGIGWGDFRHGPKGQRGILVQFEPRMSATGAKADKWVSCRSGTEGMIAQGIAYMIGTHGYGSADIASRAKAIAGNVDINAVVSESDVALGTLNNLAQLFAEAKHPVAIAGGQLGGIDQPGDAFAVVEALNGLVGGSGASASSSGQNTALQNFQVQYSSYQDVLNLIAQMNAGNIQVLLVDGANPVFDLPEKTGFTQALAKVPYVVSFNPILDETGVNANLILPTRTYLESWGTHYGQTASGTPFLTSQQPVVEPLYGSYSAADVILAAGPAVPNAGKIFSYNDEVTYLKDQVSQVFSSKAGGDSLVNGIWERFQQYGGWWPTNTAAPTAPANTTPTIPVLSAPSRHGSTQDYPFNLVLIQTPLIQTSEDAYFPWLIGSPDTMTSLMYVTYVEIHPNAAKILGVNYGSLVKVTTPTAEIEVPVYVYRSIRPDTIAISVGLGHTQGGRFAQGHGANPLKLLSGEASQDKTSLTWNTMRARVTPTGRSIYLPVFESLEGTTSGFINRGNPTD